MSSAAAARVSSTTASESIGGVRRPHDLIPRAGSSSATPDGLEELEKVMPDFVEATGRLCPYARRSSSGDRVRCLPDRATPVSFSRTRSGGRRRSARVLPYLLCTAARKPTGDFGCQASAWRKAAASSVSRRRSYIASHDRDRGTAIRFEINSRETIAGRVRAYTNRRRVSRRRYAGAVRSPRRPIR